MEEEKTVQDEEQQNEQQEPQELEINKKNREDYENLMKESSTNLDGYWDKNNPFVKIILLVLGIIIVLGAIYYGMSYLGR